MDLIGVLVWLALGVFFLLLEKLSKLKDNKVNLIYTRASDSKLSIKSENE